MSQSKTFSSYDFLKQPPSTDFIKFPSKASNDPLNSDLIKPKQTIHNTLPPPIPPPYFKPVVLKQKSRKSDFNSDIDSSDVEKYTPKVNERAKNYKNDEKKYKILGAHKFDGILKFAVLSKKDQKINWYTKETMRIEHLGLLLHFYETHLTVGEIVAV